LASCAILFDLDGTLVDTIQDLAAAANRTLQEIGLPALPAEDYRLLVGAGAHNLMARCCRASGMPLEPDDARADHLVGRFKAHYAQNWHACSQPYPGIEAALSRLTEARVPFGVLSNKPDDFTHQVVRHFFPDQAFAVVRGQRDREPLKPDPAIALELARQLGCQPSNCVLVGDSGTDMETAVRAGFLPVGVLWGFRDEPELRRAGAARLAENPDQLVTWLLDWCQTARVQ
jgi:phosphoglycolate phosphatase